MNPVQRYQHDLKTGLIFPDRAQQHGVQILQQLHGELIKVRPKSRLNIGSKLGRLLAREAPDFIHGVYFWGGVGRGKTYLMDIFHDSLPFEDKLRTHFHRFMQGVHQNLNSLKGEKNPLRRVAENIAGKTRVICFDEFFVSDIGDAMILAGLLDELFLKRVVLVATSNIQPAMLYVNGLQRERFLPAIELLNKHTRVVEIDGGIDYRLRSLSQAELYHCPLGEAVDVLLHDNFRQLAPDYTKAVIAEEIDILGRRIKSRYCSDDVIWFDFDQLCAGPRSAYDYVEIAKIYHALLVGNIPQLDASREDQARRFISLIDELYDRNVKLIVAAAVPLDELYVGITLKMEFQRTLSRLLEMQSHVYLSRPHRP